MKSGKSHMEEEDEEEEDFGAKKDTPPSNNNNGKKNNDKAAMRSKHSVTEQRRRSKINERFQLLRELIPQCDQKRDTASFLLEVIQYVQYLQERVQKYEGSHQTWGSEPTKLMPWRNSHWRTQAFVNPQAIKNGSGPVPVFPGRFDDNNIDVGSTAQPSLQNPIDSDIGRDVSSKQNDPQVDLANPPKPMQVPLQEIIPIPVPVQSDVSFSRSHSRPAPMAESSECPVTENGTEHPDDVSIEGGTINISSAYSQGLLNTLTQALQNSGVDLSQATISVQINLGKRANRELVPGISTSQDQENSTPSGIHQFGQYGNGEDLNQAPKRMKL